MPNSEAGSPRGQRPRPATATERQHATQPAGAHQVTHPVPDLRDPLCLTCVTSPPICRDKLRRRSHINETDQHAAILAEWFDEGRKREAALEALSHTISEVALALGGQESYA